MGGAMAANVSAYLYHLIVGRILGPVAYGELAALLALFFILNVPSSVLQTISVKFFSSLRARNEHGQIRTLFVKTTFVTLALEGIFLVLLMPFFRIISEFLQIKDSSYLFYLYLTVSVYMVSIVPMSVLQAYQKFPEVAVFTNIGMFIRLVLSVFAAQFGVGLTLIANLISNCLSYIGYFFPLKFIFRYTASPLLLSKKAVAKYSIPAFVATLCITLLYSIDVVLVKHFFDPHQAGIYSSLSVLGKVIFFASNAVGFVVFPMIAERRELKKKIDGLVIVALSFVGGVSGVLTILYFIFPSFVVRILFGNAFDEAIPFLGFFGIFLSFFSLSSILSNIYLAIGNTKFSFFMLLASVTQILGIFIFHETLLQVIMINSVITGVLFVSLLLYYPYGKRFN